MDTSKNEQSTAKTSEKEKKEQPLPIHNPLDPNDEREITQEDIENEQKYKEAMTERD